MVRARTPNVSHGGRTVAENVPAKPQNHLPTIKLIPHHDPRSNRPSLTFPPISRTLPHENCVIRVGRYSERDMNSNPPPNTPSSAPVGFKSKVVSRRHCEFWCSQGQWYIKDAKSSSGTFLNHIRLSQPSLESRPWPVKDGDVVQLGIDFQGGEEMIFRCVKIRVECNRAWQKSLNNYNVTTHKRLRDLGRTAMDKDSDALSSHSSECSICLMPIAPCQCLFVAPCSHVWHYKCIRPILNDSKVWPQFLCPNCRAVTDLEADIDDPADGMYEDYEGLVCPSPDIEATMSAPEPSASILSEEQTPLNGGEEALHTTTSRLLSLQGEGDSSSDPENRSGTFSGLLSRRGISALATPPPTSAIDWPGAGSLGGHREYLRPITPVQPFNNDIDFDDAATRTPSTDMLARDGPMTPTNNAGPFVFDGSAGRAVVSVVEPGMGDA